MNCRKISVPNSGNLESYYLRKFWDVTLREEEPIDWLPAWCEVVALPPSEIEPWPRAPIWILPLFDGFPA